MKNNVKIFMTKQNILYSVIVISLIFFQNTSSLKTDNSNLLSLTTIAAANEYFPLNNKKILIYKSDFGETKFTTQNTSSYTVAEFSSDRFIYRQKLLVKSDGVYVKETYQKINVLLFVNQEADFSYSEPLPRLKFPLLEGQSWRWEGTEFNKKERNSLSIKSNVIGSETVRVTAGEFKTVKVVTEIESESGTKNKVTEWYAKDVGIVKSEIAIQGGGLMGFARDLLGYGNLRFELAEIKNNND